MTELLSLVVIVRTPEPVTLPATLGRAVNALLLRWLEDADPELARCWHDAEGVRPYTCSTVIGSRREGKDQRAFDPEVPAWFRLTALNADVCAALDRVLADPPDTVEIDRVPFHGESITADPAVHPWAGRATYQEVAAPFLLEATNIQRRVALQYTSPVAFRQNGMNMPVPLPGLVFGGLAERWNAFSPVRISPEVRRFAETSVALNGFRLRSRAVPGKAGSLQIGAVGSATYTATRYDRYWMGLLGLLADFAFYGGVGRGVTQGMGQTRRRND